MTRAFTDDEKARIGWVEPVSRKRGDERFCHHCRHYCFRDAEKTPIGNGGAFGHLVPCCRVLENTGSIVRTTLAYGVCDNWERRP